jgi:hypothetical protein
VPITALKVDKPLARKRSRSVLHATSGRTSVDNPGSLQATLRIVDEHAPRVVRFDLQMSRAYRARRDRSPL